MPSTAVGSGLALILVGIAGYIWGIMGGNASLTAFIPAAFGLVLVILGLIAKSKESLRKHLMHAAVMVGLIGFLIPTIRVLTKLSTIALSAALVSQLLMAVICLVFVALCVKSFIDARRSGAV